jgi:hypothetical protein
MNRGERIGLAITVLILGYDLSLYLRGKTTIRESIWASLSAWRDSGYEFSQFPVLTVLLPLGVGMQSVGLFCHLISGLIRHNAER